MKTLNIAKRLILTVLAIGFAAMAASRPTVAAPPADKVFLAPHRAIYDLKLARSKGSHGLEAVRGRILYDFSGNACDGYQLQFRQVSELDSGEGKTALSDLRSTTWEAGNAQTFRFNSENLIDDKRTDRVDGHAERNAKMVAINLSKPKDKNFTAPVSAVFPTEHMRRIIAAAREGKSILEFPVYDGSESGEKLYNTLTVIGQPIAPGAKPPDDADGQSPRACQAHPLAGDHQLFRATGRRRRANRRADAGLCHLLRALRERHLARAGARLQRFHHQGRDDVAGDEEAEAVPVRSLEGVYS